MQLTRDVSLLQVTGSDGAAQRWASSAMYRPQCLQWFADD